jgi:hypothetical protein
VRASVLLALLLFGCRNSTIEYKRFESADRDYSCDLPASWRLIEEPSGSAYPGFIATPGGESDREPAPSLTVSYHRGKPSMRDYVDQLARNGGSRKVQSEAPEFSGNAAQLTRTLRQTASMAEPGKIVDVKEAYMVIEIAGGGFYVLRYAARISDFPAHRPAFERMASTFKTR